MYPVSIAVLSCGVFFIIGLVTGVWKFFSMMASPDGKAPVYVDICHRSSLMYAFACLVLAEFARLSVWPARVNALGVIAPIIFFGAAVGTYAVHGLLRDTDNALRRPHVMGSRHLSNAFVRTYVGALVVGEFGGFLLLFTGSLARVL